MKLRRYTVATIMGTEGSFYLKGLILHYANSYSLKAGEVDRIADLEKGQTILIKDLGIQITRTS